MAVGFPVKADYATGDVLSANNMNDLSGTLNTVPALISASSGGFAAGKNAIINGDFRFNQRGFTTSTTSGTYGFDRWLQQNSDGTVTYTPQTFTPGTAPVSGYEGTRFAQLAVTGQTLTTAFAVLSQRIESVRTLAGQTATFSFWAKANTGTPKINIVVSQVFGSGGSPSATVATIGTVKTITTSWARYEFTISVPSISGKTIGTTQNSDYLDLQIVVSGGSATNGATVGLQNNTFQIWGVQAESNLSATSFQTASGSIAGELALCQRYYQKSYQQITAVPTNSTTQGMIFAPATTVTNTSYYNNVALQVTMRAEPTVTIYSFASSTAGAVSTAGGTDQAASSGLSNFISDKNFVPYNASGGSVTGVQGGFVFHYAAVSEL